MLWGLGFRVWGLVAWGLGLGAQGVTRAEAS